MSRQPVLLPKINDGACSPSLAKLAKLMPGWTDSPMAPIMEHQEAEELIKKYKEWVTKPDSPEIQNEFHNAFCEQVTAAVKMSSDGQAEVIAELLFRFIKNTLDGKDTMVLHEMDAQKCKDENENGSEPAAAHGLPTLLTPINEIAKAGHMHAVTAMNALVENTLMRGPQITGGLYHTLGQLLLDHDQDSTPPEIYPAYVAGPIIQNVSRVLVHTDQNCLAGESPVKCEPTGDNSGKKLITFLRSWATVCNDMLAAHAAAATSAITEAPLRSNDLRLISGTRLTAGGDIITVLSEVGQISAEVELRLAEHAKKSMKAIQTAHQRCCEISDGEIMLQQLSQLDEKFEIKIIFI